MTSSSSRSRFKLPSPRILAVAYAARPRPDLAAVYPQGYRDRVDGWTPCANRGSAALQQASTMLDLVATRARDPQIKTRVATPKS